MHFAHTALPEVNIADGQRLIDEKNLRIHMDRHGKGKTNGHTARVSLDRLINKGPDLSEGFDILIAGVDFLGGKAQNGCVEINVVAAGEFGVEAGPEFEQRRHTSVDGDVAASWMQNARN